MKYHSDDAAVESSQAPQSSNVGKSSIGREIYKHLMNGVSHMLPFVVGGGVLIAISFAVFGIYSFDPNHETYNAFSAQLKEIGGLAIGLKCSSSSSLHCTKYWEPSSISERF